jgi:hypothetical protein
MSIGDVALKQQDWESEVISAFHDRQIGFER